MLNPTVYSVIGIYLTLTGLLGTFFYIHRSNWLRDFLRLKAKWDNNKRGTDAQQKTAIRECRFELKGLFNHIPFVVSFVLSAFIWLLYTNAKGLLSGAPTDALAGQLIDMLSIFVWTYYLLTAYFLVHGLILGVILNRQINPK